MAIAGTVLDIFEEENLQDNAKCVGTYLKEELKLLQQSHNIIGDVRGVGLLVGVEFVKDRTTRESATEEAKTIQEKLVNN